MIKARYLGAADVDQLLFEARRARSQAAADLLRGGARLLLRCAHDIAGFIRTARRDAGAPAPMRDLRDLSRRIRELGRAPNLPVPDPGR